MNPQNFSAPIQGMSRLPLVRQLGVLVGLAASIAIGIYVVTWAQEPGYRVLYAGLADKDQARIVEELAKTGIPHRLEAGSGAVMVPGKQVHEARLKLAASGLPKGSNEGFESMTNGTGFGTSQLVENARYQHALEGELARSIQSIRTVQSARVHLALPKQSAFLRNRQPPTASVVVNLYPGRNLDEGQVAAIMHLVASSVPNLEPDRVSVIDQQGRLLSSREGLKDMALSQSQFDYARRLEDSYARRIETLLLPIIGPGGVRAQVSMDIDFTVTEQTQETYKPDGAVVRSEQVAEDRTAPGAGASGVPGALSNQPPPAGVAPQTASKPAAGAKPAEATEAATNSSKRMVRNFEIDKTISHTRQAPGRIRKLSVAVVVDNKQTVNSDGELERKPLTKEELEHVTALVREAIGFNAERKDTVQVTNIPFTQPPEAEPLPEPPLHERPWVWDVGKQALAALAILILVFVVLRPLFRSLSSVPRTAPDVTFAPDAMPMLPGGGSSATSLPGGAGGNYDQQLGHARSVASQDPRRVAQVVKNWVANDA